MYPACSISLIKLHRLFWIEDTSLTSWNLTDPTSHIILTMKVTYCWFNVICFALSSAFLTKGVEASASHGRRRLQVGEIQHRRLSKPIIDERHAWVSPEELMVGSTACTRRALVMPACEELLTCLSLRITLNSWQR